MAEITHDIVMKFIADNGGSASFQEIQSHFTSKRYFEAKGLAVELVKAGRLRKCLVRGSGRRPKTVFALVDADVPGLAESAPRVVKAKGKKPKAAQIELDWNAQAEQAVIDMLRRRGGRLPWTEAREKCRGLKAVEGSGISPGDLFDRMVQKGVLIKSRAKTAPGYQATFVALKAAASNAVEQRPTAMTHLEFMRRFDEIRKRVGVLGIIEMQGLTGLVLDEDIELSRDDNPSLAQSIEIAHILATKRMIRVLPYQIRYGGSVREEIDELLSCQAITGTSSPTKVYARLAALGYSTTLSEVRKAMGFPEFDGGHPE